MADGIWARLIEAQSKMGNPKLDKVNPRFNTKYATLSSIIACVRGPLNEAGLFVWNEVEVANERSWMVTKVTDGSETVTLGRVEHIPGSDSQKVGSALTYSKRQSLCAAFGVVGEEDDDANAAVTPTQQRQQPRQQRQSQQQAQRPQWQQMVNAFYGKCAQQQYDPDTTWLAMLQDLGFAELSETASTNEQIAAAMGWVNRLE